MANAPLVGDWRKSQSRQWFWDGEDLYAVVDPLEKERRRNAILYKWEKIKSNDSVVKDVKEKLHS